MKYPNAEIGSSEDAKQDGGGRELYLPPEPPGACAQLALRVPAKVGIFNRYACWRLLRLLAPQEGDGQLPCGA